jgi:hypothetical protein
VHREFVATTGTGHASVPTHAWSWTVFHNAGDDGPVLTFTITVKCMQRYKLHIYSCATESEPYC